MDGINLDYANLTAERIRACVEAAGPDKDLTVLIPKGDAQVEELLRKNGFRYTGKRLVETEVMTVFKLVAGAGRYEDMAAFFDRRASDYDLHMADGNDTFETSFIELFRDLPETTRAIEVLDLGCGTGAELRHLFRKAPKARVTAVDMSRGMLELLMHNYREFSENIETVCASYLTIDLGENRYDCAVACSTLHHLLADDKLALYLRIRTAMKKDGRLLISDYCCPTTEEEEDLRQKYLDLIDSGEILRDVPYHIDLTMTFEHEMELVGRAGFMVTASRRMGDKGVILSARRRDFGQTHE